jgi:PIN domain nuclease of toxin-antitoxin system
LTVRLLLDTHVFLWWLQDSPRLSEHARDQLAAATSAVLVSAVSIWEIAIKASIGKLTMEPEDLARLGDLIALCGFTELPVTAQHAAKVVTLPHHHSDPFDRLLIAQARVEDLTIVTADQALDHYDAATLDPEHDPEH